MKAAQQITKEGLSRCNRLHVHFYESDKHGHIIGAQDARCGSDVAIVISAKQCRADGIARYRPSANVILSEGANGVIGVRYFRFIHRLRRDPTRKRIILRRREEWAEDESGDSDRRHPHTMITRTKSYHQQFPMCKPTTACKRRRRKIPGYACADCYCGVKPVFPGRICIGMPEKA